MLSAQNVYIRMSVHTNHMLIHNLLNQAHVAEGVPGFLKLLWFMCWYVCACVCVSTPEGINNQWRDMV